MTNPVAGAIDAVTQAKEQAAQAQEATATELQQAATQVKAHLEGSVDPEIAGRCNDALDSAVSQALQALNGGWESVQAALDSEIVRLEAVLNG